MLRKKKIIHFHPNGRMADQFVRPLIDAELKAGYESMMVNSILLRSERDVCIHYDLTIRNLMLLPLSLLKICSFFKKHKPDLVISHNSKSSVLPLIAARLLGVPHIVYFNHGVPYKAYKGLVRYILLGLEYINCLLADELVTVSSGMKRILDGLGTATKVSLVHKGSACGIDLETFRRVRYANSSFRSANKISKNDFVVVFIGRPERRKGFDVALRLWSEHFSRLEGYKLVLCGPTNTDILRFYKVAPKNVVCLGFCQNIAEVLSNSDCLILPSLHEGLSYAIIDALACGCFVVANNIIGAGNILSDSVNGFLVDNNSEKDYIRIISTLMENLKDYEDITKKGVETAVQFSRTDFLPEYLTFIKRIFDTKKD